MIGRWHAPNFVAVKEVKPDNGFPTSSLDPGQLQLRAEENGLAFDPPESFVASVDVKVPQIANAKRLKRKKRKKSD